MRFLRRHYSAALQGKEKEQLAEAPVSETIPHALA